MTDNTNTNDTPSPFTTLKTISGRPYIMVEANLPGGKSIWVRAVKNDVETSIMGLTWEDVTVEHRGRVVYVGNPENFPKAKRTKKAKTQAEDAPAPTPEA